MSENTIIAKALALADAEAAKARWEIAKAVKVATTDAAQKIEDELFAEYANAVETLKSIVDGGVE